MSDPLCQPYVHAFSFDPKSALSRASSGRTLIFPLSVVQCLKGIALRARKAEPDSHVIGGAVSGKQSISLGSLREFAQSAGAPGLIH